MVWICERCSFCEHYMCSLSNNLILVFLLHIYCRPRCNHMCVLILTFTLWNFELPPFRLNIHFCVGSWWCCHCFSTSCTTVNLISWYFVYGGCRKASMASYKVTNFFDLHCNAYKNMKSSTLHYEVPIDIWVCFESENVWHKSSTLLQDCHEHYVGTGGWMDTAHNFTSWCRVWIQHVGLGIEENWIATNYAVSFNFNGLLQTLHHFPHSWPICIRFCNAHDCYFCYLLYALNVIIVTQCSVNYAFNHPCILLHMWLCLQIANWLASN